MTIERKLTAGSDGDFSDSLNASLGGWSEAMGLHFLRATAETVQAELEIGPEHLQAYGIVHGGVHSGVIETIASVGAALTALPTGQAVVGVENHTSFLLAVREGKLHATARPLMRGRRTQVWEASIVDDAGRTVASGRVRFIVLEKDSSLAGEKVGITRSATPQ
ncbi:MAG TPA: PaaI family thioesterase [Candidatus Angelobacter sp.]